MILSYTMPGAEASIKAGTKIHTLRSDKANAWKAGRIIQHSTGRRTPEYNCFLENTCISTQQVLLVLVHHFNKRILKATIDRRRLTDDEVRVLAKNDGFPTVDALIDWFFKDGHDMWGGKLINWTDLKY